MSGSVPQRNLGEHSEYCISRPRRVERTDAQQQQQRIARGMMLHLLNRLVRPEKRPYSLLPTSTSPTSDHNVLSTSSRKQDGESKGIGICLVLASCTASLLLGFIAFDYAFRSSSVDAGIARPSKTPASLLADSDEIRVQLPVNASLVDGGVGKEARPFCQRTLLYQFAGAHGFASEYLIFLRIAVLARQYDYALFVDDQQWNYGRWTNYFVPIDNGCAIPDEIPGRKVIAPNRKSGTPLLPPAWTAHPHVVWSKRYLDYLDDVLLAHYVDHHNLEKLHNADISQFPPQRPLDAAATVPPAFHHVFELMSQQMKRYWLPNTHLQASIDQSARLLESYRGDAGRTVIGMHMRLGDKSRELANYGPHMLPAPPTFLKSLYASWRKHIAAAKAAFPGFRWRQSPKAAVQSRKFGREVDFDSYLRAAEVQAGAPAAHAAAIRPVLAVMSDDSSEAALRPLLQHPLAQQFDVVTSLDSDAPPPTGGFVEEHFNSLNIASRIGLTLTFLRDMTLLAAEADGLVITGSSNVGRLMALLVGPAKMKEGRLRSADVRWFPTVRYQ